jgi:hypothetical protein
MKSAEASIFLTIVFFMGSINLLQALVLSVPLFTLSFVTGRLLEKRIDRLACRAAKGLDRYPNAKRIFAKYM